MIKVLPEIDGRQTLEKIIEALSFVQEENEEEVQFFLEDLNELGIELAEQAENVVCPRNIEDRGSLSSLGVKGQTGMVESVRHPEIFNLKAEGPTVVVAHPQSGYCVFSGRVNPGILLGTNSLFHEGSIPFYGTSQAGEDLPKRIRLIAKTMNEDLTRIALTDDSDVKEIGCYQLNLVSGDFGDGEEFALVGRVSGVKFRKLQAGICG